MNITQKFEILQKLDSLLTYSELLPADFKGRYVTDLDILKKRFAEFKCTESEPEKTEDNVTTNKTEVPAVFSNPVLPVNIAKPAPLPIHKMPSNSFNSTALPPPAIFVKLKGTGPLSEDEINEEPDEVEKVASPTVKKSSFKPVLKALLPKLTEEGKKMIGDLSLPIDIYLVLKSIDDKSSVYNLFEEANKLHFTDFLSFANSLYYLEQEKFISIVKTTETIVNSGMIKFDDLFVEGKIIPDAKLKSALELHKPPGGSFQPKRLIDLKLIAEDKFGQCMKIQKWVSRTAEKAPFVQVHTVKPPIGKALEAAGLKPVNLIKPELVTNLPLANSPGTAPTAISPQAEAEEQYSKLFDFIIPVLNGKGQTIINSPDHKDLAARISFIDGNSSLLELFRDNRESFKNKKFQFLKYIRKLEAQDILVYKANDKLEEGEVWIKFGELLISLGMINKEQLDYALEYKEGKTLYIGQILVELKYIEENLLDECLQIQKWLNLILSNISYESSFVNVIQGVLKDSFKCAVDIANLRKVAFPTPLKDIVYIKYSLTGKLNGNVYYISDRSFMQNLANTMMTSVGSTPTDEFDESYVAAVSSVIITNSLTKLSQMGLFSNSEIPRILMEKEVSMDKEVVIADHKTISMVPLINQWGRFAIGLEIA